MKVKTLSFLLFPLILFLFFVVVFGNSSFNNSDPLVIFGPTDCTYDTTACAANDLLYDDGVGVSYGRDEAMVVTSWNDSIDSGCLSLNEVTIVFNYDSADGGAPEVYYSNDGGNTWNLCGVSYPSDQTDHTDTCSVTPYYDCSNINQIAVKIIHKDTDGGKPSTLTIDHLYVKINYTRDTISPTWSNLQQSSSIPGVGAQVSLSAYWNDNLKLSNAWLATNETGAWKNYTDIYLVNFNGASEGWSNFTWKNSSVPVGTVIAWKIYANDSAGNENVTDIMTFKVVPVVIRWFNQAQSTNIPGVGAKVNLSAYWSTNGPALAYAWLATNETGNWENKTTYGSPLSFGEVTSGWSNFTWQNLSVQAGTVVAWRICANDTVGNENCTNIRTFEIKPTYLLVDLFFPPKEVYTEKNPYLIVQNSIFTVNATIKCYSEGDGGFCSSPIGSVRYNQSSNLFQIINATEGALPFWRKRTIEKIENGTINFIVNGGFERGDTSGWLVVPGLQTPSIDTISVHDGKYSFGAPVDNTKTISTPNTLFWKIVQNSDTGFQPITITDDLYFTIWIGGQSGVSRSYSEYSYTNVTLGFDDGTTAVVASTLGYWYPDSSTYLGGNPSEGKWSRLTSRLANFKPVGTKIVNITIEVRKGPDTLQRYYPGVYVDSITFFNGTLKFINSKNLTVKFLRSYTSGYKETSNFVDYASLYQGASASASSIGFATSKDGQDLYLPKRAIDDRIFNESYLFGATLFWKSNNEGAGAWLNITFPYSVTLSKVVLWDDPGRGNNVTSGHLEFSDGSRVKFGALPPDGKEGLEIKFPPKKTKWIRIVIDSVEGTSGLLEVDAYASEPSEEVFVYSYTFPEVNQTTGLKEGIDGYFEIYDLSGTFLLHNQSFNNIMGGDAYKILGINACSYLYDGDSCQLSWLINATGPINSVWSMDVNASSPVFSIEKNDTIDIPIKIVKNVKMFNLTILNESGKLNHKAVLKLFNKDGDLLYSSLGTHSQPLEYMQNYSLEITQKIVSNDLTVAIYQINISRDLDLKTQIVKNYDGYVPTQINRITSVFAFNDTDLNYSYATLYIPKEGINVNKILHCLDWNFTSTNCSNWEVNDLSFYNVQQNSTHVWFNVSDFYAYAGGESAGYNSKLEIWDDTDTKTKYVGDQVNFYANYSNATSGESIYGTGVTCNISFNISGSWTSWEQMTYNSSSKLYEYNRSFTEVGTFNWNVSCDGSSLGYDPLTTSDTFTISSQTYLEVYLDFPSPGQTTYVVQNSTFWVNATVICRGGNCGSVNGTIRYNASSVEPNSPIPTTYASSPFFINESPAYSTKECGNLLQDQSCKLSWLINATGPINSVWSIDVYFNASLTSNDTSNAFIEILDCLVDITLHFSEVKFGELTPSTVKNPAVGNSQNLYNVSVNEGSCTTNLYIRGDNLVNTTYNSFIGIGNITFSNTTNDYSASSSLSSSYQVLRLNIPENTNVTTWFWINVPPVYAGYYRGIIYIKGERSA
ncbi:MAG: hypothetical protein J7L39_01400 [Candidatus Aenigmarchaeota archaeon]|nr:hypothetical protein [Candidatus Aenigmarchaeota archaeon]